VYTQPLSTVIWAAASTGTSVSTNSLRKWSLPFVSVAGHVSGAATVTLMYSVDGVTFYAGPSTTLSGASDFSIDATCGFEFVALKSSANVTATAVISATR
jgi:hypothetical protein